MKNSVMNRNVMDTLHLMSLHPQISDFGKIIMTMHAYYPIAIIQTDLTEHAFEDFVPVEKAILRCVDVGIKDKKEIADFLALPERYIHIHFQNLEQKQEILNSELTKLGRESLERNVLVTNNDTKQMFVVDAVNGYLLPGNIFQNKQSQISILDSEWYYFYIRQMDDIDMDDLTAQIYDTNLTLRRSKVLNVNVTAINDIQITGFAYLPVFVVWMENLEKPLVFFTASQQRKDKNHYYDLVPLFLCEEAEKYIDDNDDCIILGEDEEYYIFSHLWEDYRKSLIPEEGMLNSIFSDTALKISEYEYNSNEENENDNSYCKIHFVDKAGSINMEILEILCAGAEEEIPITRVYKFEKFNKQISFKSAFAEVGC